MANERQDDVKGRGGQNPGGQNPSGQNPAGQNRAAADAARMGADAAQVPLNQVQNAFTAALEAQQEVLRLNSHLATELASFATRRMEASSNFVSRLTSCRTPADLAAAQSQFWSEATTDYSEELQRLARQAQEAWTRIGSRAAKTG